MSGGRRRCCSPSRCAVGRAIARAAAACEGRNRHQLARRPREVTLRAAPDRAQRSRDRVRIDGEHVDAAEASIVAHRERTQHGRRNPGAHRRTHRGFGRERHERRVRGAPEGTEHRRLECRPRAAAALAGHQRRIRQHRKRDGALRGPVVIWRDRDNQVILTDKRSPDREGAPVVR